MKASLESLANFICFVVWADGEYDEAEKEAVVEIAETFGLNQLKFHIAVEVAINRILRMDEKEVNEFLHKAADDIDDVEIGQVYESAMQVAIADGVLTRGEVNNLLAIADALGIDTDMACLLLCDMVKTEAELEIDTEEDEE